MKYTGQSKLDLFVENSQIIKKEFAWQNTLTKRLAAILYAQELQLFAVSIIAGNYVENVKDGVLTATLSTSITNIIIAQQAAMIAAISASGAAAAASS